MAKKHTNPFTPAQPAAPRMFVGREVEVQTFRRQLRQTAAGGSGHVLVTGQRGIGKSSFANYLASLAADDDDKPPFEVFRLSVGERQSPSELLRALIHKLQAEACAKRPFYHLYNLAVSVGQLAVGPFRISRREESGALAGDLERLLTWIRRCGAALGDGVVLSIFIDEVDRLNDLGRFAELLKELFESERQHPFQLVLVGMPEAREKMHAGHPSVLRNWEQICLGTLAEKDAVELVQTALGQEGVQAAITGTALDLIVHWSDCYPYLLQHLGFSCFEVDTDGTIGEEDFIDGMLGTDDYRGSIAMLSDQLFDEMTRKIVEAPEARWVLFRLVELSEEDAAYVQEDAISVQNGPLGNDVARSIESMVIHVLVERDPLYKEQVRISSKMLWIYLKILHNRQQLPENIKEILAIAPELTRGQQQDSEPLAKRGEATVLFVDIVGYTSLVSQADPENFQERLRQLSELFHTCIDGNDGRIVLFQGDGILGVFRDGNEDHSVRGVRAAHCILDGVKELRSDLVAGFREMEIRLGLDRGEVVEGGDGLLGSAVNIAARASAISGPDGITVTGSVVKRCQGMFPFLSIGRTNLRNTPEEVEFFRTGDT